eukprot:jgi/Chrzof1/1579/Cz10g13070.t1
MQAKAEAEAQLAAASAAVAAASVASVSAGSELQEAAAAAQSELDKFKQLASELEQQVADLEGKASAAAEAQSQLAALQQAYETLQQEHQQLQQSAAAATALQGQLEAVRHDHAQLQSQLQAAELAQRQLESLSSEHGQLQQSMVSTTEALHGTEAQLAEAQIQLQQQQAHQESLQQQLQQQVAMVAELTAAAEASRWAAEGNQQAAAGVDVAAEVSALNDRLTTLEAEKQSLQNLASVSEASLQESIRQVEAITADRDALSAAVAELTAAATASAQEAASLKERLSNLEAEGAFITEMGPTGVKAELDSMHPEEMQQQLLQAQQQIQQLQSSIEQFIQQMQSVGGSDALKSDGGLNHSEMLSAAVAAMQNQLQDSKNEQHRLQQAILEQEGEQLQLQQRLSQLEQELAQSASSNVQQVQSLQQQLTAAHQQYEAQCAGLSELRQAAQASNELTSQLQADLQDLLSQHATLTAQTSEAQAASTTADESQDMAALKSQLSEAAAALAQATSQAADLEQRLQQARTDASDAEARASALQVDLDAAADGQSKIVDLQLQLDDAIEQRLAAEVQVKKLPAAVAQNGTANDTGAGVGEDGQLVEELRGQLATTQRQLAQAQAAYSAGEQWRMTMQSGADDVSPARSRHVAAPLSGELDTADQKQVQMLQQLQKLSAENEALKQQVAAAVSLHVRVDGQPTESTSERDQLQEELEELKHQHSEQRQQYEVRLQQLGLECASLQQQLVATQQQQQQQQGGTATASDQVDALTQEVEQLRAALADATAAAPSSTAAEPSDANDIELLRFENELLRGDIERLRALDAQVPQLQAEMAHLKAGSGGAVAPTATGLTPEAVGQVAAEMQSVLRELQHCDLDVTVAQGGGNLTGGSPMNDEGVDALLQAVARSSERLEHVRGKAEQMLQHTAGPTAANDDTDLLGLGGEQAGLQNSDGAGVRSLLLVLLSELTSKCQQINELKCDRLLAQAVSTTSKRSTSGAGEGPGPTGTQQQQYHHHHHHHQQQQQLQLQPQASTFGDAAGGPTSATEGVRSMFAKLLAPGEVVNPLGRGAPTQGLRQPSQQPMYAQQSAQLAYGAAGYGGQQYSAGPGGAAGGVRPPMNAANANVLGGLGARVQEGVMSNIGAMFGRSLSSRQPEQQQQGPLQPPRQ